ESCCHWTRLRRRGATFFPYTTLFRSTEAVDPDSLNVQEVKLYQEQACDAAKLQTVLRGVPAAVACLQHEAGHRRRHPPQHRLQLRGVARLLLVELHFLDVQAIRIDRLGRSEERRVGKECSSPTAQARPMTTRL